MVYVISKAGKPLMPTKRHGKVRRLLKQGLAKVVRRDPFTIQLLYDTTTYTQPVTVGVDIGSKVVGISAVTNKNCSVLKLNLDKILRSYYWREENIEEVEDTAREDIESQDF